MLHDQDGQDADAIARRQPGRQGSVLEEGAEGTASGAIAPNDLGPRQKTLHRTTSRVKLNRAIIIGSKLANRDEVLNNL
jgi:hypothetical protein